MFPEDTGMYTIVLKNMGGECRTSCTVSIEGMTPQAPVTRGPMAPKVVKHLNPQEVNEGNRARLDCTIAGYPELEVGTTTLSV